MSFYSHPKNPDKIKQLSPIDIMWEFKFGDIKKLIQSNLKVSQDPNSPPRQKGIADKNLIRMMQQNIKLYEIELRKNREIDSPTQINIKIIEGEKED